MSGYVQDTQPGAPHTQVRGGGLIPIPLGLESVWNIILHYTHTYPHIHTLQLLPLGWGAVWCGTRWPWEDPCGAVEYLPGHPQWRGERPHEGSHGGQH